MSKRFGGITAILIALTAGPGRADAADVSADEILSRLQRLAKAPQLNDEAVFEHLGLRFVIADESLRGPGKPQIFKAEAVPAYLSSQARSLLRIMPTDSPHFRGQGKHRPSVMLNLMIEQSHLCMRPQKVQSAFFSRGEWRLRIPPYSGANPVLAFPVEEHSPREIWFIPAADGCISEVVINENCFTPAVRGCVPDKALEGHWLMLPHPP